MNPFRLFQRCSLLPHLLSNVDGPRIAVSDDANILLSDLNLQKESPLNSLHYATHHAIKALAD